MYINKSNFLLILTCLIGILFPLSISAQNNVPTYQKEKLAPHEIVAGVILIVTGLFFCFLSRRFYRITLFLIGFYIGAIVSMITLTNVEPFGSKNITSQTLILIISFATGFIVGLIFMYCSTVAIWFLGALAGYSNAILLLALKSEGIIHSKTGRIIFIIVFTILGLSMAYFFKNFFKIIHFILAATGLVGSFAIILGINLFVRTGFAQSVGSFMVGHNSNIPNYNTTTIVYLMLAGMNVFSVGGSIFQYKFYGKYHFGPGDGTDQPETGEKKFQFPWRNHK